MVLRPFLIHFSWRLTRIWDSMVWYRQQRVINNSVESVLVLQGLELLSICKNGSWDFIFVPYLFKTHFSVPDLEGTKLPWLWWWQRCLGELQSWLVHLQNLCASPSFFFVCFYDHVVSFSATFFTIRSAKSLFSTLWLLCQRQAEKDVFPFPMHNTANWFRQAEQNELQCREC